MKKHFTAIMATILVFVWAYTALSKLSALNTAVMFLRKSPFATVATEFTITIIVVELLLALLLLHPRVKLFALKGSLALLAAFTVYIIYMLAFYTDRPCGCGGIISSMSWEMHLFFNSLLMAGTFFSIKWFHYKNVDQPGHAENLKTE